MNRNHCLFGSSLLICVLAWIFYLFTKPNYNVGDASIYYQQHSKAILNATIENANQLKQTYIGFNIKTEDNFTIYMQQCIHSPVDQNRPIKPILFVNGGPGIPPLKCPLFLELLSDKLNNEKYFYIPYIYHQRGTGKSSRLYDNNQSFSTWNDKSNAFEHLHKNLGIHQHILDIERIRQFLFQRYRTQHPSKAQEEKISLIGHSFGAIFSTLYAAEFTENVDTLILIAGAPLLDFNVFYPKYDIFSMIREYLSESMVTEFDKWSSKFTNFYNLMESNETEIINVFMGFIKYYGIANKKYLQSSYTDYEQNVCLEYAPTDYDYNNIGGWMSIAIYYDMGMWHYWSDKVKENICEVKKNNVNIKTLVLHCEYDLQTSDASFEYVQLFDCNMFNKKQHIRIINDTVSKGDHTIVYNENVQCVKDLVHKINHALLS